MVTYEQFYEMSYDEAAHVSELDMSAVDFRSYRASFCNICIEGRNLKKVLLSDTIMDPQCVCWRLDENGEIVSQPGWGNTPSHAAENSIPVWQSFSRASDRERCAYLGLKPDTKLVIVPHKK